MPEFRHVSRSAEVHQTHVAPPLVYSEPLRFLALRYVPAQPQALVATCLWQRVGRISCTGLNPSLNYFVLAELAGLTDLAGRRNSAILLELVQTRQTEEVVPATQASLKKATRHLFIVRAGFSPTGQIIYFYGADDQMTGSRGLFHRGSLDRAQRLTMV